MKYKIPDTIFGKKVEGAMERVFAKLDAEKKEEKEETKPNIEPANIPNRKQYIILPGKTHGTYSYPDLLVSAEKRYHGKNWNQAHEELHKENSFMLTIRQFADFLNLLKSGNAFLGNGNKADSKLLEDVLDEIITARNPWRSEWLDADFKIINEKLHINYGHEMKNKILVPGYSEETIGCLMQDKTPGIDFANWLKNADYHGLPKTSIKDGSLYYWHPRQDNNSVAGFNSFSGRAYLDCYGDSQFSGSALGVRPAKIFEANK